MKVVIIDDEQNARDILEDKIQRFCPELNIVAVAESASAGYDTIKKHKPDLVFLDIAMPMESGFDMLNMFEEINFEIIFVTGYDQFAINAIEFSAIGYILKPVNAEELIKAVFNAKKRLKLKWENKHISNLLSNLKHRSLSNHRIAIPSMQGIEFVIANDIIRFEGFQSLTTLYVVGGKKMVSSYNIGEFRKLLSKYNFFSPHRSHLINLDHIKKYLKEGTIIMADNSSVSVSRRKKSEFLEIFKGK